MSDKRTCKRCGVDLVLGENWTDGAKRNYSYICRECVSANGRAHYTTHKERALETQRARLKRPEIAKSDAEYKSAYYARNREKWREYNKSSNSKRKSSPWHRAGALITWIRVRSAKRGMEFDLTREWAEEKIEAGVCEVTGLQFEYRKDGKERFQPFIPSVDRIDSSKGYTQDNCRMVVWIYNMAKAEWDDDTVLKMATALVAKSNKPA